MKKTELLTLSAGQNPIELVTLGDTKNPKVLFIGGVHGDEPEGTYLMEDFIEHVGDKTHDFKSCVLLIPAYNPDGLKILGRTNASGVDLNRNFPSSDWSPKILAPRYNPGAQPKSEPETKALVKLLLTQKPYLVVHFHTYIPQINYTGEMSKKWAEILAKDFGHPVTDNIGYPTPGSLGQYCFYDLKTPCVCVELPEKVERKKAWSMIGQSLMEIATSAP